ALTNPVADGLPVHRLPPELLAEPKAGTTTIPLTLLRQEPPPAYRLTPGDVLGVWIEGVLGEKSQAPPVHLSELGGVPPSLGSPGPVREAGTLVLPFVKPVPVRGLTVEEAQEAVRKAYTEDRQILVPGRERIIVTLLRRRQYHVLVLRQDSAGPVGGPVAP